MNKEKYLEIKKLEIEESECRTKRKKLESFLNKYKYYIDSFKSIESREAIRRIKRYIAYLSEKPFLLSEVSERLIKEYRKECSHDIIFEEKDNYYCPLCRRYVKSEEIPYGALIITVEAIYNLESPVQCEAIYKAIDYILENNLENNVDAVRIALEKIIPHMFYSISREEYKVRRKQ